MIKILPQATENPVVGNVLAGHGGPCRRSGKIFIDHLKRSRIAAHFANLTHHFL